MVRDDFLILACGEAVNLNFVRKFYIWYQGFGAKKEFEVRVEMEERSAIVDIFNNIDDAKECIKRILETGKI